MIDAADRREAEQAGHRWIGDAGDDTAMLCEAHVGFLFRAPENVKRQFPQFKAIEEYRDFLSAIKAAASV